jgi:flagellar FliL protein
MADLEKTKVTDGEVEEPAPPKKSKRKLIIFAVIGVVVLALAGGGAFLLFGKKKNTEEGDEAVAEEKHVEKKHDQAPVYLKLDVFTTNLAAEDAATVGTGAQYIQVVVELKMDEAPSGETVTQYMPEIRNNILRLLSSRRPSQLASVDGKDLLAEEIRNSVNGVVNPGKKGGKASRGPVESVLFSSFIIQ